MAQPEDYIAERVWSDFDVNSIHQRSLNPSWPHTAAPGQPHPNQIPIAAPSNIPTTMGVAHNPNPQSHLPQLLAHSRSLPPPLHSSTSAPVIKHETPSFGASLHLPHTIPGTVSPHHHPSSSIPMPSSGALANHQAPQFTSPSLYSSFHQLPQHNAAASNYANCAVTSLAIPKSEPRWTRPPMQPPLQNNNSHAAHNHNHSHNNTTAHNPYLRPPLPNAPPHTHYGAQYNSFPPFVPGDASISIPNPDTLVDPTLGSNSSTVLSSVTTSVPDGSVGDSRQQHNIPSTTIVNAASAEVAFNGLSVHTDNNNNSGSNIIPLAGGITKMKQRRRYSKPKSSRYCHLCARHDRAVGMFPCGNVDLGICQKSVCEKCFALYGLDMEAAKMPRVPANPRWTCPHCNNACPKKAKCHSYDRQTERRRTKTRELKRQLAAKMQATGTAS